MNNKLENIIFLETHYFLNDHSHSMDAFILHRCESEMLNIFKVTEKILSSDRSLILNSLAKKEGGLIQWLQATISNQPIDVVSLFINIIQLIFSIIPHKNTKLDRKTQKLINKKLELEIDILKAQYSQLNKNHINLSEEDLDELAKKIATTLQSNIHIRKSLSNYYKNLQKSPKISSISFSQYNSKQEITKHAYLIPKEDFSKFISSVNEFIEEDEYARIHIYSPNLTAKKHKWRGYYEKEAKIIEFNMKDKKFIQDIQEQKVEFINGTIIDAILIKKIKYQEETKDKISCQYTVKMVIKKSDRKGILIETSQGKKYRQTQKNINSQQSFDFDN